MVCKHLIKLEKELLAKGIKETHRGKVWTKNCREWVYFDCYLNLASIRKRLCLDECVKDHIHFGTHDGTEAGFVCNIHKDAIMGFHKIFSKNKLEYK